VDGWNQLDYAAQRDYWKHRGSRETARLDRFLQDLVPDISNEHIALWIDVVGAGYQVLEGISETASNVLFIQIEVETIEIWKGQKLK
jgi:hypothetical protein